MTAAHYFVIAPQGMLGQTLMSVLAERGCHVSAGSRPELDITRPTTLEAGIPTSCTAVFNCSAYTQVDDAESHQEEAQRINGTGVGHLAELCRQRGIPLVHYSTDYVFAGDANTPYPTDTAHSPVNAYGRSKAAGEKAIWDSQCEHLLVRTSWLYAPFGNNFVRTMARLSEQRPNLTVVNDQRGRPTSCEYLARQSLALLEQGARGTFHVTDGGECTWFEFTQEIVRRLSRNCDVQPCGSDAFPRPAPRPAYSVLDLSRTEALLGPSRHWHDNLQHVLDNLAPL